MPYRHKGCILRARHAVLLRSQMWSLLGATSLSTHMELEVMSTDTKQITGKRIVRTGRVAALCYSAELINGVGKEVRQAARITKWGIPGDKHYGETRISKGRTVPNDRTITVVGAGGVREACERLGIAPVQAGGMGENILCEGLGDLDEMEIGDEIHVLSESGEPKVILLVRGQNPPCSSLMVYHKQMPKAMMGKRGVLCTVLQEGDVQTGDSLAWVRAQ